ncbi:MAG TPA: regulatory protein RecX [bacterium]|jgi:regulatory protein|nr:regulatory protein RecX [bacterium]
MFRVTPTAEPDCINAAKNYALNLLSRRSYSCKEVALRLRRKGFVDHVNKDIIQLMKEYGYIDDVALAKRELDQCLQKKRFGPKRIQLRLRQRGIAPEIIAEVMGSIDTVAVYELCFKEAQRKLKRMPKLDTSTKHSRLSSFLFRRGFESDSINQCLRELLDM